MIDANKWDEVHWRASGMLRMVEHTIHRETQKAGFGRSKKAKV